MIIFLLAAILIVLLVIAGAGPFMGGILGFAALAFILAMIPGALATIGWIILVFFGLPLAVICLVGLVRGMVGALNSLAENTQPAAEAVPPPDRQVARPHTQIEAFGDAEKLADNLYRFSAGDYLVVTAAGAFRRYRTERGARQFLERERLAPASLPDAQGYPKTIGLRTFAIGMTILVGVGYVFHMYQLSIERQSSSVAKTSVIVAVPPSASARLHSDPASDNAAPQAKGNLISEPISSPQQAHPERWKDPTYVPNEHDYDVMSKVAAPGDWQKQQDMKDALCAFYGNCR